MPLRRTINCTLSFRNLLMLIHHMIEFVIREGPMFEAMIMNREINNPMFRFLFENQSPAHIYYRWKLFSMLQGDIQYKWRTQEFRMFKGGSIWRPPPMNPYTQGMPEELVEPEIENRKGTLSPAQRDRLEDLIRNITPERLKVAEVMVFCIEHSDAAEEICDVILESLSNLNTAIHKKIARLYLISDILHNCGVKISNASHYRRALESRLLEVYQHVHQAYQGLESRMKAEGFRVRVMQIFRAWEDWAVYPKDFLIKLQNAFLGLTSTATEGTGSDVEEEVANPVGEPEVEPEPEEEIDADNEDLDGVPLDGAALLKGAMKHHTEEDIDGIPMEDDIDGKPMDMDGDSGNEKGEDRPGGFVLSRWETVDPELVEAQAMTTSKWEMLEQQQNNSSQDIDSQEESNNSLDNRDASDNRRAKLREIEVKVMQYQDELESGKRSVKSGWTIPHQVEHYRRKLLRKAERGERSGDKKDKDKSGRRSSSPEDSRDGGSRKSKRSRSSSSSPPPSKKSHRSKSRSPSKKSRRSRSPHSSRKGSPSSSRSKRSSPSRSRRGSPSPPSSSSRSSRYRSRSNSRSPPSSRSKHSRALSPSTPPRKHKHKHKY